MCVSSLFKVAKWWKGGVQKRRRGPGAAERKTAVAAGRRLVGGVGLDARVGTNALTPFPRCRGPPPGPHAPAREWKLPFPSEEGGAGGGRQARHYHFDCFDAIFGGGGVGRPFCAEHKDV